jgi:hypothetical protein
MKSKAARYSECPTCERKMLKSAWIILRKKIHKKYGILNIKRLCKCGHKFEFHSDANCDHEIGGVCCKNQCAKFCAKCKCEIFRERSIVYKGGQK